MSFKSIEFGDMRIIASKIVAYDVREKSDKSGKFYTRIFVVTSEEPFLMSHDNQKDAIKCRDNIALQLSLLEVGIKSNDLPDAVNLTKI